MKKLLSCSFTLFLAASPLFAQYEFTEELSIKEGPVSNFNHKTLFFLSEGDTIYDVSALGDKKLTVSTFDQRNYALQSAMTFQADQFFARAGHMIKTQHHQYFLQPYEQFFFEFDPKTGFGAKKEFSSKITSPYKLKWSCGAYLSSDSTKILIVYRVQDNTARSKYRLLLRVFDEEMSLLSSTVADLNNEYLSTEKLVDFAVGNTGDCAVLEREDIWSRKYHLTLVNDGKASTEKLVAGELTILDVKMAFAPSGELCVGGVYGVEKDFLGKGFFLIRFNSRDRYELINSEFTEELMLQYQGAENSDLIRKNYEAGSAGINYLVLKSLAISRDGNIDFVAEKNYLLRNRKSGATMTFEDMVLSRFSQAGREVWTKRLPKAVAEYSLVGYSEKHQTRVCMNEKYCYIFFYDHKGNASVQQDQSPLVLESIASEQCTMGVYQVERATGSARKMYFPKEKFPNSNEIYLIGQNVAATCVNSNQWVELTFAE